jgi:hypothetical protein
MPQWYTRIAFWNIETRRLHEIRPAFAPPDNSVIGMAIARDIDMRLTNQRTEVLLGRAFAACRYPVAAWHRFSFKWRVVTVAAYAAAGYVTTLAVLFAFK